MRFDEALLLPPDEVDYPSFDNSRLLALATQGDEPFIATNALTELRTRGVAEARAAAEQILKGHQADRHLRALAVTTVFDGDPTGAMPLLLEVAQSDDPKVLSALMEGVLLAGAAFDTSSGQRLVDALAAKASVIRPDAFTDADVWSEFTRRFPSAVARPTR